MIMNKLVRVLVKYHDIPLSILLTLQFAMGLYPGHVGLFMNMPADAITDLHMKIGTLLLLAVGLMIIGKIFIILLRIPRPTHSNCFVNFLIANHWFFLSSSVLMQYVTIMYSRQVAEILGVPRPKVKKMHFYIGIATLAQICIVTTMKKLLQTEQHFLEEARKEKLEAMRSETAATNASASSSSTATKTRRKED